MATSRRTAGARAAHEDRPEVTAPAAVRREAEELDAAFVDPDTRPGCARARAS
jgi:hypothetical protein